MTLTEYETTVIIRPDIGGDAVETTLDRMRDVVRNNGGKLLAITHWGKKKLTYEIEKHARGIYVHTHYLGKSTLVGELERNLRITDNILRFLTVRLARHVAADERQEKPYEKPQYDLEADTETEADFGGDDERDHRRGEDRDSRYRERDRGPSDDHEGPDATREEP